MMKTSIIIPNWNGRKLLEKNLPAVLAAEPNEIIVVDDKSTDDSIGFLEQKYPQIRIIKHSRNLGFAVGCNDGVKAAEGEIVVLLNSDVIPESDFLSKSLPLFDDPVVFAVSFHEPSWSWAKLIWKNGLVEHEPGEKTKETHISAWASGGSAAFRKSIWQELGGFDKIYKPFYWEDVDISYRAWKSGYKVLWDPNAIVHHKHEGTIGKNFSKDYINIISERNRLLFIWKNISDLRMLLEHKLWLLRTLSTSRFFWRPFMAALVKLPLVLQSRLEKQNKKRLTDKDIFGKF